MLWLISLFTALAWSAPLSLLANHGKQGASAGYGQSKLFLSSNAELKSLSSDRASAFENFCTRRGFVSGFGPVSTDGEATGVMCLRSKAASVLLHETNPDDKPVFDCIKGSVTPVSCKMLVHRYCARHGFASGYGPTQWQKGQLRVVCLPGETTELVDFHEDRLQALGLDFEFAYSSPESYATAAHRLCREQGYLTGFGTVEVDFKIGVGKMACVGPRSAATGPKLEKMWSQLGAERKAAEKLAGVWVDNAGVNSTRFTRPHDGGLAFGRRANSDAGDIFSLSLHKWVDKPGDHEPSLTYVKTLLDTKKPGGLAIDKGTAHLSTAYDPSSVVYHGETWVAFECAGNTTGLSAGVCMGKFENGQLKPESVYVLVHTKDTPGNEMYSASVPKLVRHRGKVYLYWSQQKLVKGPFPQKLISIQTKGVELFPSADGRLMGPKGAPYHSDDGVTVAADTDSFDAVSDGEHIYLLGAAVPKGCETPHSPVPGCYDMLALRTKVPLAPNAFTADKKKIFPWNQSHEYSTFYFGTQGHRNGFFAQYIKSEKNPGRVANEIPRLWETVK